MDSDQFTLGIEEEFQIIDPRTRELTNAISQMMEARQKMDSINIMGELHQSVVEVASGICQDIKEARAEVVSNRLAAVRIAQEVGMKIAAASTHPFSRWQEQQISEGQRYQELVGELQDVARANLIFGLHVHVGIPDREDAIAIFNQARYFLPHILAMSTSSPFLNGRNTGLQSVRSLIFKRLPRTGIPEAFTSYSEYTSFIDLLVKTRCVDGERRMWWDLRPHPIYSTLEFRIADLPTRVDDVVAIAALVQAIVATLMRLHRNNQAWRYYPSALIEENKWRAVRYGVHGKLIDFGRQKEVPVRDLMREVIDLVAPAANMLGSLSELEHLYKILDHGTSADRQLQVYEETKSLEAVVDHVLDETVAGVI